MRASIDTNLWVECVFSRYPWIKSTSEGLLEDLVVSDILLVNL